MRARRNERQIYADKSSLFNRIMRSQQAIVAREAGTTRDNVVGDEEIELSMGCVRTLHVCSAGEHTTELWQFPKVNFLKEI